MKKITLNRKQKIAIVVAAALVCTGGFATYKTMANNAQQQAQNQSQIDLYYVPSPEKIFIKGKLVPYQAKEFNVSSEQGVLNALNVENGAIVEEGTLLYSCKNPQVLNEIDDLQYEIDLKYKEQYNLKDQEAKKSIDVEINNMYEKMERLKEKAYSYVYAPFGGKVYLNSSNTENAGSSVMTLESTAFYIEGKVNEYDLFKINVEQEVEVMLYATKEKITGKITSIGDRPSGNGASQDNSSNTLSEYGVSIEVEQQESFKNGLHIQGIAQYAEANLKIPVDTIIEEDGKSFVYKIENDIAKKAEISILEKNNEFAVINSGVNQGDILARNAASVAIVEGQNIYGNNGTSSEGGVNVE